MSESFERDSLSVLDNSMVLFVTDWKRSQVQHFFLKFSDFGHFQIKKKLPRVEIRINDVIHVITSVLIFYFMFYRIELP